MSREPNCYLIVERMENWLVDKSNGFQSFGIPDRYARRAATLRVGDLLIGYVSSGKSSFADVRELVQDGTQPLRFGGDYDSGFSQKVSTRPKLVLDPDHWVKVHDLVPALSFLKDKGDWRQAFRTSLAVLSNADAQIIINRIKLASETK